MRGLAWTVDDNGTVRVRTTIPHHRLGTVKVRGLIDEADMLNGYDWTLMIGDAGRSLWFGGTTPSFMGAVNAADETFSLFADLVAPAPNSEGG